MDNWKNKHQEEGEKKKMQPTERREKRGGRTGPNRRMFTARKKQEKFSKKIPNIMTFTGLTK
jgi:hypothetical protein